MGSPSMKSTGVKPVKEKKTKQKPGTSFKCGTETNHQPYLVSSSVVIQHFLYLANSETIHCLRFSRLCGTGFNKVFGENNTLWVDYGNYNLNLILGLCGVVLAAVLCGVEKPVLRV